MPQNPKLTTITFNGQLVGGVETYSALEGQVRESTFRPLDGSAPTSHPNPPDFGQCFLSLYYDAVDAGQSALRLSLAARTKHTMVITDEDGNTDTFSAFCLVFPRRGSKGGGSPITTSQVLIRVDGAITSA